MLYATAYSQSGVYVTGHTDSSRFPIQDNAYDGSYNGRTDVFICALDTDLKNLIGSTFLGGDLFDSGSTLIFEPQDVATLYACGLLAAVIVIATLVVWRMRERS